jgi:hypothetical protein
MGEMGALGALILEFSGLVPRTCLRENTVLGLQLTSQQLNQQQLKLIIFLHSFKIGLKHFLIKKMTYFYLLFFL